MSIVFDVDLTEKRGMSGIVGGRWKWWCGEFGKGGISNLRYNRNRWPYQGTRPGMPALGITFQFYNSDLLDICTPGVVKRLSSSWMTPYYWQGQNTSWYQCWGKANDYQKWRWVRMVEHAPVWVHSEQVQCNGPDEKKRAGPSGNKKTRPIQRQPIFLQGTKSQLLPCTNF